VNVHRYPRHLFAAAVRDFRGVVLLLCLLTRASVAADPLPAGTQVVWDVARAWRETTPTRERVCLNGLWRWQPASAADQTEPTGGWGYFKVPGSWPGITDYLQKDSQTVFAHPDWKEPNLGRLTAAWYEREFTVPDIWAGRRIALRVEYLHSLAIVFVDGQRVGEGRFPGGDIELGAACRPGAKHRLCVLVVALPLKGVMRSYTDTASARDVEGTVERRGLCGDVYLVSTPAGPRLADVRVETSVRKRNVLLDVALEGCAPHGLFMLRGRITRAGQVVHPFTSQAFRGNDLARGRITLEESWMPDRLWDLHTPQNQFELELELADAGGAVLDTGWSTRFGFREFWIEGRDFFLNGSRVHLSAVPLDNAQVGAAAATYSATRESLERLQSLGINFVYTHNYGCEPGSHLGFEEILRAADDVGMLVAFSQPHFSHYEWQAPEAERDNGYARHAEFYVRAAQNHASVVMYAMSHNATGYNEDMNPDLIDGIHEVRDSWALRNVKLASRAEAIVRRLDPGRPIYHHASGNLGPMHVINFYPNFAPVQELSDWFGHWATEGVKPVFLCEYGAPFTWDWAMYRGWYQGKREFGSAAVPWEFCLAEWNAQFFGDRAFAISEQEKRNLRWEAKQFRAGKVWHRWDYPHPLGSTDFVEREPVFARYFQDNWRAFRTWGVSANSPWEHDILFKLRPGLNRNRRGALPVDWANLQRPGFSPDFLGERYERMDLAYERGDWIPTAGATALIRNNRPLLAYIAGKSERFTSQDHLFIAGQTVAKQLIVINNARVPVHAECEWSLGLPHPVLGEARLSIETGQQARVPLEWVLPNATPPGKYKLTARVTFDTGETQSDEFIVHVLPQRPRLERAGRVALFDPRGETAALLARLGVEYDVVTASADLEAYDILVLGKASLTATGPAPDLVRVRDGLKVLVFEQTAEALERRLGFRVAEYGLRNVFPRTPDHPALAGLQPEHLRDWRGVATLLPTQLKYERNPKFNGAPTVNWCGLPVTRVWRCGSQGNVASVLIEKPACGDFLPIVDGGFSLQYSPLLEFREGTGSVIFCQMDVTGRSEEEPAADRLVANLLDSIRGGRALQRTSAQRGTADSAGSEPRSTGPESGSALRLPLYAGDVRGKAHLEAAGFRPTPYTPGALDMADALIVGPSGGSVLEPDKHRVAEFLRAGGRLLGLGLSQADLDAFLPFPVVVKPTEHINAFFEPPAHNSLLAGVGPADVHSRDARALPLITSGARVLGDGVLAMGNTGNVVLCQITPWEYDYGTNFGVKRTFRRASTLLARLLGNLGIRGETPLLSRFSAPVKEDQAGRWLQGLYLDSPEEWDDPYRFFRW